MPLPPNPSRPAQFQINNQWLEFYLPALKYGAKISANSLAGDTTINVEDSGLPVGAFGTLDFVGFTVVDNGGGNVSIQGGPGSGVFLQEDGTPLSAAAFVTLNFIGATLTDQGGALADITITPDASTINWSTTNWTNFFDDVDWSVFTDWNDFVTSLTTNWSTADWDLFTSTFFSNLSSTEIDNFIDLWDGSNFGTFIDQWVANTSAGDWDTFIDAFITNVDDDDVQNFLDQLTGIKGDILVNDGTNWNKLPVGTDGQVLTADSGEANGVAWTTTSSSGIGLSSSNTIIPFAVATGTSGETGPARFFREEADAIYVLNQGGSPQRTSVEKWNKDTITGEIFESGGQTGNTSGASFTEICAMDDTYIYVPQRRLHVGSLYFTDIEVYDKATMTLQITHVTDMPSTTSANTYWTFNNQLYIANVLTGTYRRYDVTDTTISLGTPFTPISIGAWSVQVDNKLYAFDITEDMRVYTLSGTTWTLESTFTPQYPGTDFLAVYSTSTTKKIVGCSSVSTNGAFNLGYMQLDERDSGTGDIATKTLVIKRYSTQ